MVSSNREQTPKVNFIDYEYGDYNYREYDIANHFNEFVGMGDENGNLDYEKYYPTKQFQLLWVKEYLQETNILNKRDDGPTDEEVIKSKPLIRNIGVQFKTFTKICNKHFCFSFVFTRSKQCNP